MQWEKLGLLWKPSGDLAWAQSHAQIPVVHVSNSNRWQVFLSTRDGECKSRIGRLWVDASGVPTAERFDPGPVLSLGEPGAFDDSGVMPSWIVDVDGALWMYYVGWNVPKTVPYRLSIGLAISEDDGATWRRFSQGPIMDRSVDDPYFVTTPCVLRTNSLWQMWYSSCEGWRQINGRWEPRYFVKHAESHDGLTWRSTGSCLDPGDHWAVARPCVFRDGSGFKMMYSYRMLANYREDRGAAYRLGFAESDDGRIWRRRDGDVGIAPAVDGWDCEMIAYCWLQHYLDQTYLLYCGNGFGRAGIAVARSI